MKNRISMPKNAKQDFILWCKKQTANPYDLIHYGASSKSRLVKSAGKQLLKIWPELHGFLKLFRSSHFLYVVLENLPVNTEEEKYVSEFTCIGLAYAMHSFPRIGIGEKFPFNTPIHKVTPEIGSEEEDGVNNGAGTIKLHNDRNFVDDKIKYLLLYGVRNDEVDDGNVSTFFVPVTKLIEGMPENLYLNLFEKNFKDPSSEKVIALLRGDLNNPAEVESNLDLNDGWMIPLTQEAKDSLEWLQNRSDEIMQSSTDCEQLTSGTCVIANDRKIVHARRAFKTSGTVTSRRLLLRLHLIEISSSENSILIRQVSSLLLGSILEEAFMFFIIFCGSYYFDRKGFHFLAGLSLFIGLIQMVFSIQFFFWLAMCVFGLKEFSWKTLKDQYSSAISAKNKEK